MKTNKMKIWIGCGIVCVLSVLLSLWYAITFNDSCLVVPMDFKNYVFEIRDLPMIVSVSIISPSLALAMGIFLSEYLPYRYGHDDQAEESEE